MWGGGGGEGQEEDLGLIVVGGGGPGLLCRDRLERLRLDWGGIRKVHEAPSTLESLLVVYGNLFRNELGTIKGVTPSSTSVPGRSHVSTGHASSHMLSDRG